MKTLLIIKTGSTHHEISKDRGDFEDWIIAGMGLDRNKFLIVHVSQGQGLPDYDEILGIAITGSHAMVTNHADWSERTAAWLPGAIEKEIPLLGICYGHQLLAYALGGQATNNPNGFEFGTVEIVLTEAAIKDPLFSILPSKAYVQVTHAQSVIQLPPGAKLMASTSMDLNHAFVIGDCAWGVQFHPEFDADIVKRYIRELPSGNKLSLEELIKNTFDTPFGDKFLKRFAEIVIKKNN